MPRILARFFMILAIALVVGAPASANTRAGSGLTFSKNTVTVTEAGTTDSYTIVLNNQPSDNVVVSISGFSDITVQPNSMTFTQQNWNTPQSVTVLAVNDRLYEGDISANIDHIMASDDPHFNGTGAPVLTNVTDNERIRYAVTSNQSSFSENAGEVNIDVTATIQDDGTGDLGFLQSFSIGYSATAGSASGNGVDYSVGGSAQFVASIGLQSNQITRSMTLTLIDDTLDEEDENIEITVNTNETGTSGSYDTGINRGAGSMDALHYLTITDNETGAPAGATLSKTTASVTEGGATDSYTLVLNTQPTDNVTVNLQYFILLEPYEIDLNVNSLTFTPQNWNVPQTVTITAVDDTDIEGAHSQSIGHFFFSRNDAAYDSLVISNVVVNITDNEPPSNNLLSNNSFEAVLGSEWAGTGLLPTDRRMCNGGGFASICMFRFNSTTVSAASRTLRQTVTSTGWGTAGDTLNFSAQAQAIGFSGAMRMSINLTYTDGTTARQRLLLPTGTYDYGQRVVSIAVTKPISTVSVSFEARNANGIMRFDNTRLRLVSPSAPLALPDPQ
jgi:hypothetical protein